MNVGDILEHVIIAPAMQGYVSYVVMKRSSIVDDDCIGILY